MIDRGVAQTSSEHADEQYLMNFEAAARPSTGPSRAAGSTGGEEEVADQDRLDDEEPREGAAHHDEPERLRERVNLREPVAGERERQEGADGDEVAEVSHPVAVRAPRRSSPAGELERRGGRGDRSAERDVGDDAVDVDRHPRVVVDGVPDGEHRPAVRDARRHEREPRWR